MMKSKIWILTILLFVPLATQAYSIGSASSGFGDVLNQLSTPFTSFFTGLENVNPNELPPPFSNPSTQIETQIQGVPVGSYIKNIFVVILNFLSLVTGWLIMLADKLGTWIVSIIK